MNSLIYRVHIFNWIRSCDTEEQLETCRGFIRKLFNQKKMLYDDFIYLINHIKERRNQPKGGLG